MMSCGYWIVCMLLQNHWKCNWYAIRCTHHCHVKMYSRPNCRPLPTRHDLPLYRSVLLSLFADLIDLGPRIFLSINRVHFHILLYFEFIACGFSLPCATKIVGSYRNPPSPWPPTINSKLSVLNFISMEITFQSIFLRVKMFWFSLQIGWSVNPENRGILQILASFLKTVHSSYKKIWKLINYLE